MAIVDIATAMTTLRALGVEWPAYLASGMEGHLFRVGDQTVAKVWFAKPLSDVTALQSFYGSIRALRLPFATPEILSVHVVDGTTISLERELVGRPMNERVSQEDDRAPDYAVDALLVILKGLGERSGGAPGAPLSLVGTPPAEGQGRGSAPVALARVARAKVTRYGAQLRESALDFDWMVTRTIEHLQSLPTTDSYPIHGDICPENILLNEAHRVSAVLDWGFLSLFGDPALDASITAGVFNMYGPHHRAIDDQLLDVFAQTLGHPRDRMLRYRALYAIITSNAYSADGADGHFAWCVEQLRREDVRSALAAH